MKKLFALGLLVSMVFLTGCETTGVVYYGPAYCPPPPVIVVPHYHYYPRPYYPPHWHHR